MMFAMGNLSQYPTHHYLARDISRWRKDAAKKLLLRHLIRIRLISDRQCFATNIVKSNRVVNNYFTDNRSIPVLSNTTRSDTSTSTRKSSVFVKGQSVIMVRENRCRGCKSV